MNIKSLLYELRDASNSDLIFFTIMTIITLFVVAVNVAILIVGFPYVLIVYIVPLVIYKILHGIRSYAQTHLPDNSQKQLNEKWMRTLGQRRSTYSNNIQYKD